MVEKKPTCSPPSFRSRTTISTRWAWPSVFDPVKTHSVTIGSAPDSDFVFNVTESIDATNRARYSRPRSVFASPGAGSGIVISE